MRAVSKEKIVIAAISARPYVLSATLAGYKVRAIDAFSDVDLAKVSEKAVQVNQQKGQFEVAGFMAALNEFIENKQAGFAYGSGFEANPELIDIVAKKMQILGNASSVLRRIRNAKLFFGQLKLLKIPFPEVGFERPMQLNAGLPCHEWLVKDAFCSGGWHIKRVTKQTQLSEGQYFQREVKGDAVSLLFIADGKSAKVIGFNQQLIASISDRPFCYAGAVSHYVLSVNVQASLLRYAEQLTRVFGLVGLNSLDAIVQGDKSWVLEVNPRLSATFDLYQYENTRLFDLHVHACHGDIEHLPAPQAVSKAHYILYAPCNLVINHSLIWPKWVADIPSSDNVLIGEPVCTVLAQGKNAISAKKQLKERLAILKKLLEIECYENATS